MKDESIRATTAKAPILLMVSTMISFMILDNLRLSIKQHHSDACMIQNVAQQEKKIRYFMRLPGETVTTDRSYPS